MYLYNLIPFCWLSLWRIIINDQNFLKIIPNFKIIYFDCQPLKEVVVRQLLSIQFTLSLVYIERYEISKATSYY